MKLFFSFFANVGSYVENVNFVGFWKYSIVTIMKNAIVFAAAMLLSVGAFAQENLKKVNDVIEPLPAGSVTFNGYFADDIQNSIDHWVNGVMPYDKVIDYFVVGRPKFALGEMPGKCIRTNSLL